MKNSSVPRGPFTTALLIIVFWGIAQARPFLVPLSVAALLAFLIAPLVRALRRARVPEGLAITIGALALSLPLLATVYGVIRQGQSFVGDVPTIIRSLEGKLNLISHSSFAIRFGLAEHLDPSALLQRLGSSAGQGVTLVITGLGAVLNAGSQLALVILFSVMMLGARRKIKSCSERIVAQNKGLAGTRIVEDVATLIQRFLIARLLIALIIAAADFAVLALFKVEYSFLLGAFLGLMTLIPAIGFVVSVIPPIAVALATGNSIISTTLIFVSLLAMSAFENYVLTPKLVGGRLNLNPLATFVGLFAGGLMWGIWGMLLSVPALGIIRIVFSATPSLQPWGELLADKSDGHTSSTDLRRESDAKTKAA